jgi:hypothetical protein
MSEIVPTHTLTLNCSPMSLPEEEKEEDRRPKRPSPTLEDKVQVEKKPRRSRRSWDENFQALVDYKQKHGNCNVPMRYKEDTALGHWVSIQRRNKLSMTLEKRKKLDELEFTWVMKTGANPSPRNWDESYQALVEYKEQHGDCNVSQDYKQDPALGQWVYQQRRNKLNLPLGKRTKLDELEFMEALHTNWSNLYDVKWEQQFACLLEFKRKHGHCNAPTTGANAKKLGCWVNWQRWSHRTGCLKPERIKKLNSIGFVWKPRAKLLKASADFSDTDIDVQQNNHDEDHAAAETVAGNIGIDLVDPGSVLGTSLIVNKEEQVEAWYCPLCQCSSRLGTAVVCESFIMCLDCGSDGWMRCYPCAVQI